MNWRAAALLGLISSTFSTLASASAAARLGRDAWVDWMVVAAIPARDAALQVHPPAWVIAVGIGFHQWADFSWEIVFFGLLGRWTARLGPWTLVLVAWLWALFTSASEWFLLVPVLPFRQPIFTLEQVYWIGLLVHVTSASIYPLFPYIRDRVAGVRPSPHRRFATVWSAAALAVLVVLGSASVLGSHGREWPWTGRDRAYDQAFMRRMAAHHAQGIALAELGAERVQDQRLRALARMMAASQTGEIRLLRQWWRSWFPGLLPPASGPECARMPGMLTAGQLDAARRTPAGPAFDALFVRLMSSHHRGAVAMADEAMARAGDLRVKSMAYAIRHAQTGEIALMHGAGPNFGSVSFAVRSMLAPASSAPILQEAAP